MGRKRTHCPRGASANSVSSLHDSSCDSNSDLSQPSVKKQLQYRPTPVILPCVLPRDFANSGDAPPNISVESHALCPGVTSSDASSDSSSTSDGESSTDLNSDSSQSPAKRAFYPGVAASSPPAPAQDQSKTRCSVGLMYLRDNLSDASESGLKGACEFREILDTDLLHRHQPQRTVIASNSSENHEWRDSRSYRPGNRICTALELTSSSHATESGADLPISSPHNLITDTNEKHDTESTTLSRSESRCPKMSRPFCPNLHAQVDTWDSWRRHICDGFADILSLKRKHEEYMHELRESRLQCALNGKLLSCWILQSLLTYLCFSH